MQPNRAPLILRHFVNILFGWTFMAACGGSSGSDPGTGPTATCDCSGARCGETTCDKVCGKVCGDGDYCADGACVAADACDETGFGITTAAAFPRMAAGALRVRYTISNVVTEPPFDRVVMEINHRGLWPEGAKAGVHELKGTETVGSPLFLRGQTFCNDVECGFTWVAEEGSIDIRAPGLPEERFIATIRNLRLKQVRIDRNTGEIQHFANARTWCVGDVHIDIAVPPVPVAQGNCVADGTGRNIGENIRNFTLMNCNGQEIDLHARCGQSKATWFIASAGWCGACEAFVPEAAARAKLPENEGLDLIVVIGEDRLGGQPSLAYCREYALAKGLDPENTFVDHDGQGSWPVLFGAINTYSGNSIGLPWNAVLDGQSMVYVWSSNAGDGDLYGAQDALLGKQ
jgi:hypothetical protein